MIILGIGGSSHDFSACIVEDGKIVVAIEEERLTREKYSVGIRSLGFSCINYCLKQCGLTINDVDMVVLNNLVINKIQNLIPTEKHVINHHLSHASAVYFTSGFYESAIYIIDGIGSPITLTGSENVTYLMGMYNELNVLHKVVKKVDRFPTKSKEFLVAENNHSLGWMYEYVTMLCGFGKREEGKLMGLAPYGSDRLVKMFSELICLDNTGLGVKIHTRELIDRIVDYTCQYKSEDDLFNARADVAYAMQHQLEAIVMEQLNKLYEMTGSDYLCLGGGVALNSVMNGKILQNTPFKHLHVYPASGDSGTAIGAALYGYYCIANHSYNGTHAYQNAYLGKEYLDKDIKSAIEKNKSKINAEKVTAEVLVQSAAEDLAAGRIIGWFQGASEIGPRALGHRSILANPGIKDMREILNQKIKFRENFRPFAPSVMAERAHEFFNVADYDFRYMLAVCSVKEEKREMIPSVTHVDGSARVQTVTKSDNGIYYDLINAFSVQTGIPLVLNTSFNIKGEPIVETPNDAIRSFINSKLDALYINDYIITKGETVE